MSMTITEFYRKIEKHQLYQLVHDYSYTTFDRGVKRAICNLGKHISLRIEAPAVFVTLDGIEVGICTSNYDKLHDFLLRAICELMIIEEYTVCPNALRDISSVVSLYGLNGVKWSTSHTNPCIFGKITTVAKHILPSIPNRSLVQPIKVFVHNNVLCISPFNVQDIAYRCSLDDPNGKCTFINILNEYLRNMVRYVGFKHSGGEMEPIPKIHHKKKRTSRMA